MNVETNTTAEAGSAISKGSLKYHVETSLEEAKTTMHLAEAATLLFRHLVKDAAEPGKSPLISHGHVEMFHTLIDLSWSRASSTFDELERFQEAIR